MMSVSANCAKESMTSSGFGSIQALNMSSAKYCCKTQRAVVQIAKIPGTFFNLTSFGEPKTLNKTYSKFGKKFFFKFGQKDRIFVDIRKEIKNPKRKTKIQIFQPNASRNRNGSRDLYFFACKMASMSRTPSEVVGQPSGGMSRSPRLKPNAFSVNSPAKAWSESWMAMRRTGLMSETAKWKRSWKIRNFTIAFILKLFQIKFNFLIILNYFKLSSNYFNLNSIF